MISWRGRRLWGGRTCYLMPCPSGAHAKRRKVLENRHQDQLKGPTPFLEHNLIISGELDDVQAPSHHHVSFLPLVCTMRERGTSSLPCYAFCLFSMPANPHSSAVPKQCACIAAEPRGCPGLHPRFRGQLWVLSTP